MELDELAHRAVAELRDADRAARFTVRPPSGARRHLRPALAVATLVVVAVGAPILWSVVSPEPVASPLPGPGPVSTVDELVTALYAALNAKDETAFRALSVDGAHHAVYSSQYSPTGQVIGGAAGSTAHQEMDLDDLAYLLVEPTGAPVVSGDAVAVPVHYAYAGFSQYGFDLLVLERVDDELRIAGGITCMGAAGMTPDSSSGEVVAAYIAAWNAGSAAQVAEFFTTDGALWDSVRDADPADMYRGRSLEGFIRASLWFDVTATSDVAFSGPFVVVANRLSAASDTSDGISLFLMREGGIVLHAFAQ